MQLRDVKLLAAGIVIVSLVTTNFILPAILRDIAPPVRVTAITTPEPIIPEPVRVLSPAESAAKAATMRAHADRVLAENGELPSQAPPAPTDADAGLATGTLKCVAGCD